MFITVGVLIVIGIIFIIVSFVIAENVTGSNAMLKFNNEELASDQFELTEIQKDMIRDKVDEAVEDYCEDLITGIDDRISEKFNEKTIEMRDYTMSVSDQIAKNQEATEKMYRQLQEKQKEIEIILATGAVAETTEVKEEPVVKEEKKEIKDTKKETKKDTKKEEKKVQDNKELEAESKENEETVDSSNDENDKAQKARDIIEAQILAMKQKKQSEKADASVSEDAKEETSKKENNKKVETKNTETKKAEPKKEVKKAEAKNTDSKKTEGKSDIPLKPFPKKKPEEKNLTVMPMNAEEAVVQKTSAKKEDVKPVEEKEVAAPAEEKKEDKEDKVITKAPKKPNKKASKRAAKYKEKHDKTSVDAKSIPQFKSRDEEEKEEEAFVIPEEDYIEDDVNQEFIMELHSTGMSMIDIAKQLGMGVGEVTAIVEQYGGDKA